MNAYCDVCCDGKLKQKPARRRRDPDMEEKPEVCVHTLLGDHLMTGEVDISVDDDKFGFLLCDVGTDMVAGILQGISEPRGNP
eukprot:12797916-Heterocapsa_arctica.AAC.1